ncbi:PREDICTED: transcription factor TGA2.2-like isoform X2 [Ipomoea nil]|uniref:transcription factor TGA2.2-like isoform X2 n=1 Tax=Ipomoea nil TaxID=35883 RepID=UPI000901087E|nr:PREDICTED: transcription factor TGA2.2-like isoform X2 [Ipomoea nil]
MGSERALFELHSDHHHHHHHHHHHQDNSGDKVFVGVPLMASGKSSDPTQQQQHHHHHQQQQHSSVGCSNQISFAQPAAVAPPQLHFQLQDHHHHQPPPQPQSNQISFGMLHSPPSSSSAIPPPHPGNFISKDSSGAYDLGELDQALFLYLDGHQESSSIQDHYENSGMRPPTLNIFPSQPMHVDPSSTNKGNAGLVSLETGSSRRASQPSMEVSATPKNDVVAGASASSTPEPPKPPKREGHRRSSSAGTAADPSDGPKTPDPKTLRRLAQNREAARKSRLRKKAYVQQLETSRIKLTQLEQELQRARAQGIYFGGSAIIGGEQGLPVMGNISSDAAVFDMEYARWQEEHHRLLCELRSAVQEHLPENELRMYVDNCLAHFDQMIHLKSIIAKSDVFHLVSGMWKTPAERCFMWMGGFRPSELLKVIVSQIEPLTEQQLIELCGLQQSTHEAEEALSQGLGALNHSLSDTIAADSLSYPSNMGNYMGQMAAAITKLSTLEGFVRQADNLRHQTMHRLHQILTTRQAARCLLAIAEYFHRLRALSALWLARPKQE